MSSISQLTRMMGRFGGYQLARALTQAQPKILMYHRFSETENTGRVSRECLRQQLDYVRRYYRPITLSQLASELFEHRNLPSNTVVITVDDGYRDFYDIAWPIARELGVPLTLFVTTGFVNGDIWLWPDQVTWMLARIPMNAPAVSVGDVEFDANSLIENYAKVWQHLIQFMLSIPNSRRRELILELSAHWEIELPEVSPPEFSACSWNQLLEMQRQGLEVGGHTVTHPSLGRVEEDQAKKEILGCMDMLNKHLGPSARSFCYPNGMPGDYSVEVASMVKNAGFSCAVTAFSDVRGVSQRYAMRRHAGSEDWFQFYKAISGIEFLGHRFRRTLLGVM